MIGERISRKLSPRDAYEAWAFAGSVYRAPLWLKEERQMFNHRTGLPFASQTVWKSANVFILNNLAEAREIFQQVGHANGKIYRDNDWYNFIFPRVLKLPPEKYNEFMEINAHLKPYLEMYIAKKKQG